jgi:hypothetical protein
MPLGNNFYNSCGPIRNYCGPYINSCGPYNNSYCAPPCQPVCQPSPICIPRNLNNYCPNPNY